MGNAGKIVRVIIPSCLEEEKERKFLRCNQML